jgi:hypothetical protein
VFKKLNKIVTKKRNPKQLQQSLSTNSLKIKYYSSSTPIEDIQSNQDLLHLDDILNKLKQFKTPRIEETSEPTASEKSWERGETIRSKTIFPRKTQMFSVKSLNPDLCLEMKKPIKSNIYSPKRELKLPEIILSPKTFRKAAKTSVKRSFICTESQISSSRAQSPFEDPKSNLEYYITNPNRYKTHIENPSAFEVYSKIWMENFVFPSKMGLEYSNPKQKHLLAANNKMGPSHLDALNSALTLLPNIQTLDLRNNNLGGLPCK